ncbi:unnamed protein product [Bathycoccus prasinos]
MALKRATYTRPSEGVEAVAQLGAFGVKQPLVQTLVVVANIQMRTLRPKWRKVPCEQQLDMGKSILRDEVILYEGLN